MALFNKKSHHARDGEAISHEKTPRASSLPTHNGKSVSRRIQPEGESGRRGFSPLHFFKICWRGSCAASKALNILWPFVPVAIALHYTNRENHRLVFAMLYIAMLPAASLLGFAGQEFARKLPRVVGILVEITFGSVVEIIVFMILIAKNTEHSAVVVKAAILGSILTNLLLCLGLCFFVGGIRRSEQEFHGAVSEVGSGLMLVAGLALLIPSAFYSSLQGTAFPVGDNGPEGEEVYRMADLARDTIQVSRGTAIILFFGFAL